MSAVSLQTTGNSWCWALYTPVRERQSSGLSLYYGNLAGPVMSAGISQAFHRVLLTLGYPSEPVFSLSPGDLCCLPAPFMNHTSFYVTLLPIQFHPFEGLLYAWRSWHAVSGLAVHLDFARWSLLFSLSLFIQVQ